MNWPMVFAVVALVLLGMILWSVWKLVRSPLPLDMQEALEKKLAEKEDAKLNQLRDEVIKRSAEESMRIWQQMQAQVQTTESSVTQRLEAVNRSLSKIHEQYGELRQATEQVEAVGRNMASLQELLRAPKMRGGLGEFFLADLLGQIFSPNIYSLQYGFSNGERVDAIIRLGEKLVPIDSKFPLEQFRRMGQAVTDAEKSQWRRLFLRDVKQHVDDIAQKYIRPGEGTFDFALMYIPAENVYYETIIRDDAIAEDHGILQHALAQKVIPVSPNSFFAYLQVIVMGLRGMDMEQKSGQILGALMQLQKELNGVREDFITAETQLKNAVKNFEKAGKHLERFEGQLNAVEAPAEATLLPASSSGVETMREISR